MLVGTRAGFSLLLLIFAAGARAENSSFISAGVKIRYVVRGQGEPVVLIHGFSDRIENTWQGPTGKGLGLKDVLSRDHRVIALDCRGHGNSGKPHGKRYGQEMVRDVIRLLDHLHLRQANLVGYSMGAFIAGNVLLRYPDRVRCAVLGGGAPFTASRYARELWFRNLIHQSAQDLEQGRGMGRIIRFLWPPNQPPPTDQQIAEINRQQLAGQDLHALAAVLRQWSEWNVDDQVLKANQVPVLAVIGSQDVMKRAVEPLKGRLARMDVVEIPGANHLNAVERPEFEQRVMGFLAGPRKSAGPGISNPTAQVDEFVHRQMRRQHIPGLALAVVRDGKLLMAKGYGLASLELNAPVRRDTVFELGSITKQFTATAIMMLVEAGKVRLDEKITTYLPDLPAAWANVTVRQLLTHTSGIKSYTAAPNHMRLTLVDASPQEVIRTVADEPLQFQPGDRWEYSNTGYFLLGLIIEKASGMPYAAFLQQRIFGPLRMTATRVNDLKAIIPNRASGYSWHGDGYRNAAAISMTWPYAAGALVSTVEDLAKWDAALYTEKLLKKTSLQQMWTPARLDSGKPTTYGFGWFIETVNGHRRIGHDGGIPGFTTSIARFVDDRLTVIALLNQIRGDPTIFVGGVAGMYLPALKPRAPHPIADREPEVTALVRDLVRRAAEGRLQPEQFAPDARALLFPDRMNEEGEILKALGPIRSMALMEREEAGERRSYRYRVGFPTDTIALYLDLTRDNKVAWLSTGAD